MLSQHKPKILLIDPPDYIGGRTSNLQLPLGLIALANYIDSKNIAAEIKIVDLTLEFLKADCNENDRTPWNLLVSTEVLNRHWDIIGFTTHFTNTLASVDLAKTLKMTFPTATIVFGGIHATTCHGELLKTYPFIDLIILGEGEQGFATLCEQVSQNKIDFAKIPNSAYRNKEGAIVTAPKSQIVLDDIGPYDFKYFDLAQYKKNSSVDSFWIESGRGCVHRCGFCISSKHWGHKTRYFSAKKLTADISTYRAAGITKIKFTHDQFTVNKKKVKEICEEIIASEHQIEWGCYSRADEFPFEILPILQKSGCRQMFIGVESKFISIQGGLRKPIPTEELQKIMAACNEYGIELETNIILGFPEHQEDNLLDELAFCAFLKTQSFGRVSISPLELYPTTAFYKDEKYQNLFIKPKSETEDLFSFQFEHRRTFWDFSINVLSECFRTWVGLFPFSTMTILNNPEFRLQFRLLLTNEHDKLQKIHGDNTSETHICDLLTLALNCWQHSGEIRSLLLLEGAVALASVTGEIEMHWSGPENSSIDYNHGLANITCFGEFDEQGRPRYQSNLTNSFEIGSHGEEILITKLNQNDLVKSEIA